MKVGDTVRAKHKIMLKDVKLREDGLHLPAAMEGDHLIIKDESVSGLDWLVRHSQWPHTFWVLKSDVEPVEEKDGNR